MSSTSQYWWEPRRHSRRMSSPNPFCCRLVHGQQVASARRMQGLRLFLCRRIQARLGTDRKCRPGTIPFGLGLAHATSLTLKRNRTFTSLHDASCRYPLSAQSKTHPLYVLSWSQYSTPQFPITRRYRKHPRRKVASRAGNVFPDNGKFTHESSQTFLRYGVYVP